jgi:hypothetical protein
MGFSMENLILECGGKCNATPLWTRKAASRLRVSVPFGYSSQRLAVYASLRLRPYSKKCFQTLENWFAGLPVHA